MRNDLYRAFGVDLTEVPGINSLTAQMLLTEIGPNLSRFPTAAAFCSWLRLCPNPKISGGQVLSSRTRPTKNRAALALRMATQGLHRSDTFLGDYFRRMKARMGAPKAMTATAHKLARIVYHMVTTQQEYDATIFQQQEQRRATENQQSFMPGPENSDSNSCRSMLFLRRAGGIAVAGPSKGPSRNRPKPKPAPCEVWLDRSRPPRVAEAHCRKC